MGVYFGAEYGFTSLGSAACRRRLPVGGVAHRRGEATGAGGGGHGDAHHQRHRLRGCGGGSLARRRRRLFGGRRRLADSATFIGGGLPSPWAARAAWAPPWGAAAAEASAPRPSPAPPRSALAASPGRASGRAPEAGAVHAERHGEERRSDPRRGRVARRASRRARLARYRLRSSGRGAARPRAGAASFWMLSANLAMPWPFTTSMRCITRP